ncbi:MAG TPA: multicopper oxidase domain-containing protein [Ilumatobacteraceae bacterium]|nr:multicopper oxidase domain-containing protein [Ilumatobacteraceae bacterium]
MENKRNGDAWWVITFVIGMTALVVSVIGVAVASGKSDSSSAGSSAGASAGGAAADGVTEVDVTLADISVTPKMIQVPAGKEITLHITNTGAMEHDLKVEGLQGTGMMKPGEKTDLVIGPFTADTELWCTVPGHKAAGMLMAVHVLGGDAATPPASGGTAADPYAGDAVIDSAAMPSADWTPRDPELPAKEPGSLHEITLDATEKLMEVAPGVTQMMWTFNDTVPGPILHGKLGDTFKITLNNKGVMGHSIDFHASKVAWNDEMRTILPGESLIYEFKADFAGAWMYHCGTAPALHHIGNGMFGAIIIDPPDLAPVAKEFVFTQSELYLGPEGEPGDLTKMINEDFDAVVFNGYFNQYFLSPIKVEKNTRYRIWLVDDGPSENSAFHIVGTIFDTVFKEGAYTLQPDDTHGGSQVLDLQPAQGGFVEFTFAEDGLYLMVTHKFSNVGKGALGVFAVGDVDTSGIGGH